jgi:hypothetical protein
MFGLDIISYAIYVFARRAVLDLQLLVPARKKNTNHQVNYYKKRVANVTTRGEKNFQACNLTTGD